MGPHYFNDGTLTAVTLANQFLWVTNGCESIGCEVQGAALDAGGCNARFVEEFFRDLRKLGCESWLDEEDCSIVNPWDLKRKIFIWFCITHLMKSFRGQILASQLGGAKAFVTEYGVPFGWKMTLDLYRRAQCMSQSSDDAHNLIRFTEAVAYHACTYC